MPKETRKNSRKPCWLAAAGAAILPLFHVIGGCAPSVDRTIADPHARVTQYLDALIAGGHEVGIQYMVVDEHDVVLEYAGGATDAATGQPVTPETTFLTASTTKVLTAAAILRLVETGWIELDAPLSKYLPHQPYGPKLTVRHLLNQSSGVPNPLPVRWVHRLEEHQAFDERRTLESLLAENSELDSAPGEKYAYSNLSYWLLGSLVESVSGRSYCGLLRAELFDPLGITRSELDCEIAAIDRHARGHQARWSLLGLALPFMTDDTVWDDAAGKWARFHHLHMNGPAYGGVVGSARGYSKFLQDLLNPKSRLLADDTRRLFFSEQRSASGEILPTTLGWHRGELDGVPYYSKPGGGPGFSGNVRIYRERRLATVFLSNRMRVSESEIQEFSDMLDREILGVSGMAGRGSRER